MYKLSGLDAGFLYNETERCPQHVSSVQVMELPAGVDEDTFIEGLKALFKSRLHLAGPLKSHQASFETPVPLVTTSPQRSSRPHLELPLDSTPMESALMPTVAVLS